MEIANDQDFQVARQHQGLRPRSGRRRNDAVLRPKGVPLGGTPPYEDMILVADERTVEFIRFLEDARPPKRAERSAAGYLPSRAMRYCDALTSATGYGYWFFPPMSFSLLWDGERIFWTTDDSDDWFDLSNTETGAIQFPGSSDKFDEFAPDEFKGCSPPFMTALPEHGGVQIWTGFLAKTRPGWSLSVRAPVNLPAIPGLMTWEGIVETDVWFGPLFNNFRLTQTNVPVRFRAGVPFLQVQPLPQIAYSESNLSSFGVREQGSMNTEEWADLGRVLLPSADREARQGLYAVTVRKRRMCPVGVHETFPTGSVTRAKN